MPRAKEEGERDGGGIGAPNPIPTGARSSQKNTRTKTQTLTDRMARIAEVRNLELVV